MGIDLDAGKLDVLGAAPLSFLATVFVAAGLAATDARTEVLGLLTAFFGRAFLGKDFFAALSDFAGLALTLLLDLAALAGANFLVPFTPWLVFFTADTGFLAAL